MSTSFLISTCWFISGVITMVYFWIKTGKAIGNPWWMFYRLTGKDFTEEEKKIIKKYYIRLGVHLIVLFVLFGIVSIVFRLQR